ncbi:tetratricopeptide repeat protein [Thalassotalea montiporae]
MSCRKLTQGAQLRLVSRLAEATRPIGWLLATLLISVIMAKGALAAQSTSLRPDTDIHAVCAQSPQQCLMHIEQLLRLEPNESRRWFQYKNYQLDALFELERLEQLASELKPWISRDDIPLKFKISVLIYTAKTLPASDKDIANQYMRNAIELLEQVSEVNRNPMIVVQIANSLNQQKEYQRGYYMLLPLVAKYENRHMPRFQSELFGNLGHFAYRLNKLDEHIEYRLSALKWARLTGNESQVAITLYNVARAYQMAENYPMALDFLLQTEQLGKFGDNDHTLINFRRAEIALAQGQLVEAERYYGKVEQVKGSTHYQDLFTQFESALTQAKSASQSAE